MAMGTSQSMRMPSRTSLWCGLLSVCIVSSRRLLCTPAAPSGSAAAEHGRPVLLPRAGCFARVVGVHELRAVLLLELESLFDGKKLDLVEGFLDHAQPHRAFAGDGLGEVVGRRKQIRRRHHFIDKSLAKCGGCIDRLAGEAHPAQQAG